MKDLVDTTIKIKINQKILYFNLTIKEISYNWMVTLDSGEVMLGGFIEDGYFGTHSPSRKCFFFEDILINKVKTELRKAKIKFR